MNDKTFMRKMFNFYIAQRCLGCLFKFCNKTLEQHATQRKKFPDKYEDFCGPFFSVNLRIQSEHRKTRTRGGKEYIYNPATLQVLLRNGVGSVPVASNSPSIGG